MVHDIIRSGRFIDCMIALDTDEAILFRLLSGFFGTENVIPHMSVAAVCDGAIDDPKILIWAKKEKCLFTIVDNQDAPRLVVEFFSGFDRPFEVRHETHQRLVKPLLMSVGVPYITISHDEFSEITDSNGSMDFFQWLKDKFEEVKGIGLDFS